MSLTRSISESYRTHTHIHRHTHTHTHMHRHRDREREEARKNKNTYTHLIHELDTLIFRELQELKIIQSSQKSAVYSF